jgi:hypothetical protein
VYGALVMNLREHASLSKRYSGASNNVEAAANAENFKLARFGLSCRGSEL